MRSLKLIKFLRGSCNCVSLTHDVSRELARVHCFYERLENFLRRRVPPKAFARGRAQSFNGKSIQPLRCENGNYVHQLIAMRKKKEENLNFCAVRKTWRWQDKGFRASTMPCHLCYPSHMRVCSVIRKPGLYWKTHSVLPQSHNIIIFYYTKYAF